jgi:hypothetical protein
MRSASAPRFEAGKPESIDRRLGMADDTPFPDVCTKAATALFPPVNQRQPGDGG